MKRRYTNPRSPYLTLPQAEFFRTRLLLYRSGYMRGKSLTHGLAISAVCDCGRQQIRHLVMGMLREFEGRLQLLPYILAYKPTIFG